MEEHSGKGDEELSITERNDMLASLWATVSTLYFIEKVCRCEPFILGFVYEKSNLLKFVPSVSNLRNAKDHIAADRKLREQSKSFTDKWTCEVDLQSSGRRQRIGDQPQKLYR